MVPARLVCLALVILVAAPGAYATALLQPIVNSGKLAGVVRDSNGSPVAGVNVSVESAQQASVATTVTDEQGRYEFAGLPVGTYVVRFEAHGFSPRRSALSVKGEGNLVADAVLEVSPVMDSVTVTAETGASVDLARTPQAVSVITSDEIRVRSKTTLAESVLEEQGLALQRTSPTVNGIYVRGLTGKNVAVYVDGIRFTTSAQRGGINTFLNMNEASSLSSVEVLRGPNSAQYGSDSLGGTVSLLNRVPAFSNKASEFAGTVTTLFDSPSMTFGSNLSLSYGTKRFALTTNLAARRSSTLRPADGIDGHAAVTRFLGLPSDVFGFDRMPDTAFTQYGGAAHFAFSLTESDQVTVRYERGQQDGGKRYDQLLGGDGNLRADLRNLMNDFFYVRYFRFGLGPLFDSATFTASYNTQREERVNQGGNGNPLSSITSQYEKMKVLGFNFQLAKQVTADNNLLLGADVYRETVDSPAHTYSPSTGKVSLSRPRIPNGLRYLSYGFFAQDSHELIPDRVRLSGALRYQVASYRADAADSPIVNGQPLFPSDSLRVSDFSGRVGVVVTPFEHLNVAFNYSRGFRAPSSTDLGTLGLTGDGYEIASADIAGRGATIGSTADERAIDTGLPVEQLRSETTDNIDLSVRYASSRFTFELTGFRIRFNDTIAKQSLILPDGAVGSFIGDQPIVSQLPSGVVFVDLTPSPVLVRTNFGPVTNRGFETALDVRMTADWRFSTNFTYIRAEDDLTGAAPNIEGGTPPATAFLKLRYEPAGKNFWVEAYSMLADRQNRLSTLDQSDRRTGGRRTRSSIASFFANGARVRGLTGPGLDGMFGTSDDVLLPTGESLSDVQSRLLGTKDSGLLFPYLPGYGLVGLRGGYRFGERSDVVVDFENIADKSFRGVNWGMEGPGRGLMVSYRYRF
ncbi:MAG: TonB-dependent receptor [Blastocatellia bacterium]